MARFPAGPSSGRPWGADCGSLLSRGADSRYERLASPGGEIFQPRQHFLRRPPVQKVQEPPQLFARGIALLGRQNDPAVRLSASDPLRVQRTVVPDVETVQDPTIASSVAEVLFVASIDHAAA